MFLSKLMMQAENKTNTAVKSETMLNATFFIYSNGESNWRSKIQNDYCIITNSAHENRQQNQTTTNKKNNQKQYNKLPKLDDSQRQ